MFRRMFRALIQRATAPLQRQIAELHQKVLDAGKTSPEMKISQRHRFHLYRRLVSQGSAPPLHDTGYRVFSQLEEDGKVLFIFAALGISRGTFIDIGSAVGINSNCANFALNFGWSGVFIDGDAENTARAAPWTRRDATSLRIAVLDEFGQLCDN